MVIQLRSGLLKRFRYLKTKGLMHHLGLRGCTDGCELLQGYQFTTDTGTEQEAEVVGEHEDQEQPG